MKLHLVRHGDANAKGGGWATDDERPLSGKGRTESRRAGEALAALGVEPDLVLTSPLVRARQTADEICAALGGTLAPTDAAVLLPGASAAALVEEIALRHPGALEVVCTGHMPDLGYVAAQLSAGAESAPFKLKTGSLVRVDLDGHESRLVWMLSPQVVRMLAGGAGRE